MLLVLDTGAEFLKTMTYVTVRTFTMETYGQEGIQIWQPEVVNLLTTAKYNIM